MNRALPSTDEELWRYSRIAELDLDAFAPVPASTDASLPAPLQLVRDATAPAAVVYVRDGHVVSVEVHDPKVEVLTSATATVEPTDAFGELHDEHAEPVTVRVPRGHTVTGPVLVLQWTGGDAVAAFPHLIVEAGDDSEVVVYEHGASPDDVRALVVPITELRAGPAARLRYLHGQLLGKGTWQIARQVSTVDRDAMLSTGSVALGGDYARLRIESSMTGRGAHGEMLSAYFGEQRQMHDIRTLQDHVAPSTTSNLLFKGVVEGASQSIYTGLIHIGKDAAGVNAFQTNRNIKLTEGAWANSYPTLEIENNDVRCSHASTVGPVDEDQRFYLESRGVRPEVAERLIVMGFFDEVLEKLPVPGVVALLRAEIAAKLARRDDAVV
ncbi:MAG: Fe-S cluster assembly protein SufD [Actinomycetota bacterium]|nr:Fe-S cluster assembly protein SufD [Actinomycetota bacterium]